MPLFDPATQELFEALCDLPPELQRRQLAEVAPELREAVVRLLALDERAQELFDTDGGQSWLRHAVEHEAPDALGRYRIVRRIGAGGMGVVYEAEESHPRRRVALKVLHPGVRSPAVLELFRFEAQALAQVEHPGVPSIYEAGTTDDGTVYLSMELVRGVPLDLWARGRRRREKVELLIQLADALHAAHLAGVLHRDIKPSNVVVGERGPSLLDFGVAAPLARVREGRQPGTPAYMSPEALAGEALDAASDVFSVGVVAYELLSEALPGTPPRPIEGGGDLSDVVLRCMELAPSARPASAAELAEDLRRVLDEQPLAWKDGRVYRVGLWRRRHRRALGWAAALIGAVGIGASLLAGRHHMEEQRRHEAAARHLERLEHSIGDALAAGDTEQARRSFDAYMADPDHHGTPSESAAWSFWAEATRGQGQGLDALAEAYLTAYDEPQARRAQRAIADAFWRTGRFDPLWRLGQGLPQAERQALARPLLEAAVARRDFGAARALAGGAEPLLDELAKATPLGVRAYKAAWVEVDPDVGHELVAIERDRFTFRGVTRELPHADGWTTDKHFAVWRGGLYLATGRPGSRAQVVEVPPRGPLRTVAVLEESTVQRLLPTADGLWVALSYPTRGIVRVDEQGRVDAPHEPTNHLDSDVLDLDVVDLDGDGVDEVAAAVGDWSAYDVRLLGPSTGGVRLEGRQRFGTVLDLAVLPGPSPWLLAGKVDIEPNLRVFPAEHPYGPEPGMYVLDHHNGGLRVRDMVPLPIADDPRTTAARTLEDPVVGDFDGDGRDDVVWTLRELSADAEDLLWFVMDVRGARRSLVVAGLESYSAGDRDGDGDDELLVGDEHGQLWVLGTGSDALPPWSADRRDLPALGTPPTADPIVVRTWERAQALVDLGLVSEAAHAMSVLPALADDPEVLAASHTEAARLFDVVGEVEAAAQHYATAAGLGADVDTELLEARLATLDLDAARAWLPGDERPVVSLVDSQLTGWDLREPAFRRLEGTVVVDAFNDHEVLARRLVEVDGDWVQLDLDTTVEALELGAGLSVSLERDGEPLLSVAFWGQGGGGLLKLYLHCGWRQTEYLEAPLIAADAAHRVTLRAGRLGLGARPRLRCGEWLDGGEPGWFDYDVPPVAPGPAELVIRAFGEPSYRPPTYVRARLHSLDAVGLRPLDTPSTPRGRSVRALLDGVEDGWVDAGLEAYWAIALGDDDMLLAVLEGVSDDERRRLLRRHPGPMVEALQGLLSPEAFATLLEQAIAEPAHNQLWRAEVRAVLRMPSLEALPLRTASGRRLRVWRAEAEHMDGHAAAARSLAESVEGWGATDDASIDALILLARLDPVGATQHLERAVAMAGTPELVYDRARAYPELAALP